MSARQFRFAYFTPAYEATIAFYRDGLEFPIVESWDRAPEDRGTLFQAAAGIIEVLIWPSSGVSKHLWDERPPQGAFMVIEVEDVDSTYKRVRQKGLPVSHEITEQAWGHRTFCVREPNGLTLYLFSEVPARREATA
jgi:catechol 2,3-dioxygenase-like lactoylglutathione lyase family enzyme